MNFKSGDKVKWTTASGVHGSGVILQTRDIPEVDTAEDTHAIVVVDAPPGEEHRLIFCALTWLTKI